MGYFSTVILLMTLKLTYGKIESNLEIYNVREFDTYLLQIKHRDKKRTRAIFKCIYRSVISMHRMKLYKHISARKNYVSVVGETVFN